MEFDREYSNTILVSSEKCENLENTDIEIAVKKLKDADTWDMIVISANAVIEELKDISGIVILSKFKETQMKYYKKLIKEDLL